jgi:hypothetical protein
MLPGDIDVTGAFVGSLSGAFTGATVGAIGTPPSNTSIPLICGLFLFRTNSIVIIPSLTKVGTVRIYGPSLAEAEAYISKSSTIRDPST